MSDLHKLQNISKKFSILYVEDNEALKLNAQKLLKKFFLQVDVAENGKVALALFKKHHYSIVITDLKMPIMDGITLTKHIKDIQPETKIIFMTAFEEKEYLQKAIELGVFRFLKKPVSLSDFTDVLYLALTQIKHERDTKLFYSHLHNIFNYQSSMVLMLNGSAPILANQILLDFFDKESFEEYIKDIQNIGDKFLEHDGFLYNNDKVEWFDVISQNEKKLFHVKMKNKDDKIRHLILKYQLIPEKKGYGILSFDDVTELKLLKLFDEKKTLEDKNLQDNKAMFDLLEVIQRNSAKIEVHNYYKGLSITNNAVISEIRNGVVVLKTTYVQQKAIQYEQKTLLFSEALPYPIECMEILKIGFDKQEIELKSFRFAKTSPIDRKTIRVVPDEKHSASLFLGENKFHGDVTIEDISIDAINLKLNALPPGLEKGNEVIVDVVLELDKRPLIINTKAIMFRKTESRRSFNVVFMFDNTKKKELIKYITKRQMSIIREFKGKQNG